MGKFKNRIPLYLLEKGRNRYYLFQKSEQVFCSFCSDEIHSVVGVYCLSWGKQFWEESFLHVECLAKKDFLPFHLNEYKYIIFCDELPEVAIPIFERKPGLRGVGISRSDPSLYTKGDAEIIDNAPHSKDQHFMIDSNYESNLLEFKEKDEELGENAYCLIEEQRKKEKELISNLRTNKLQKFLQAIEPCIEDKVEIERCFDNLFEVESDEIAKKILTLIKKFIMENEIKDFLKVREFTRLDQDILKLVGNLPVGKLPKYQINDEDMSTMESTLEEISSSTIIPYSKRIEIGFSEEIMKIK